MRYLIDTHVLLWYLMGDSRISQETKNKIESERNSIYLSNASLWEITIKLSIGKLRINGTLSDLKEFLKDKGFLILDFDFDDLETLLTLPFHHQDPFDRLIISQSKTKSLEIITNDNLFDKYF